MKCAANGIWASPPARAVPATQSASTISECVRCAAKRERGKFVAVHAEEHAVEGGERKRQRRSEREDERGKLELAEQGMRHAVKDISGARDDAADDGKGERAGKGK